MPILNLSDVQRHSNPNAGIPDQYDNESARGGRYLAVVVALGFLFWLGMAFVLGAWVT